MEKIKEFFNALMTDPKAKELLNEGAKPENQEEMSLRLEQVAKELGYDLSGKEIQAILKAEEQSRKARTDEAAAMIRELPDDALDAVAGGKDHDNCKDTYKDKENKYENYC